jgi:hypothetical protein
MQHAASTAAFPVKKSKKWMVRFGITKTIVHLIRIISLFKTTFMKRISLLKKSSAVVLAVGLVITATAWQVQPGQPKHHTTTDTVPERNKKVKDIDAALEELEKGKLEMEKSLKDIDWKEIEKNISESIQKIDMAKIQVDIDKNMKAVDMAKIQADVDKAMKEVDMEKLKVDISKNLTEVDGEKIKAEVARALKDVDFEKIKVELDASLSKVDMEKIKSEMQKIKDVDMKKIQSEIATMKPDLDKTMADARKSIDKAKTELLAYKGLIDGLDRDKLINKKEDYTIEYKKGALIINGKKQPDDVVKKYQNFLKDRRDFTIKKNQEDFNIDND